MTDAIPQGDIVAVLRMADAGKYTDDLRAEALVSAVWNGLIDHQSKITDAGRELLTKVGPLYPEGTPITDTCVICGRPIVMVHELDGNGIWIDPEPVADGDLVLRGDPLNIPPGEFVAAFHNVGPDGDDYFGIPAGAPRYRQHDCKGA